MLKTIVLALVMTGLFAAHYVILDNSESIAKDYATVPYQEASDEDLGLEAPAPLRSTAYSYAEASLYNSNLEKLNALKRYSHYRTYFSDHVSPIQRQVELYANIVFSLMYAVLALFAVRGVYRWVRMEGGALASGGLRWFSGLTDRLLGMHGIKGALRSHQLGRAETEFARLKSLFDNGLITEAEFLAKKAELTSKIRNDNLLNKG